MPWLIDTGEVFEHRSDAGVTRFFDVEAMRTRAKHCPGHGVELIITETAGMDPAWLRANRGIEPDKLERLTVEDLADPVLMVEMDDGTHLLVDGHHRWVKLAESGVADILAYRFPLGTWERFLIHPQTLRGDEAP